MRDYSFAKVDGVIASPVSVSQPHGLNMKINKLLIEKRINWHTGTQFKKAIVKGLRGSCFYFEPQVTEGWMGL